MIDKLKPCPFCGSSNIKLVDSPLGIIGAYYCVCNRCNINTAVYTSKEKAIKAWNRRAENA